ncbi:hypothetical protein DVH05_017834 [Phytophthora capsici]|nr:hypothetical protein DVH05_014467 [Phytophthora capsici]KAG1696925.1 hypothetical protein DVH05_017834 [Phytophthora capsici]
MGHVDGLSRLLSDTVTALTMRDLLNPDGGEHPSSVGDQYGTVVGNSTVDNCGDGTDDPAIDDGLPPSVGELNEADGDRVVDGEPADGHVDDPGDRSLREDIGIEPSARAEWSPVDRFGLDREQFVKEQQEVPWIKALVAFLRDGALPLDPFLRARVVQMGPR